MTITKKQLFITLAIVLVALIAGIVGYNKYQNRIITTEYYIVDAHGTQAQVAVTKHKANNDKTVDMKLSTEKKYYKDVDAPTATISIRVAANFIVDGNLDDYELKDRTIGYGDSLIDNTGKYIVNNTDGTSYIESK